MLQKFVRALTVMLLIASATLIVLPTSADAADDCNLVLEPFVFRDAGFSPSIPGDPTTVTGGNILAFFNGDSARTIADANQVLRTTNLPPGVPEFYRALIAWVNFVDSNACAAPLAYPGPFENMPPAPVSPYGFSMNPTAASFTATDAAAGGVPASVPAGPALAHTGAETTVLAVFGAGLVGFGALALGSRRRYL